MSVLLPFGWSLIIHNQWMPMNKWSSAQLEVERMQTYFISSSDSSYNKVRWHCPFPHRSVYNTSKYHRVIVHFSLYIFTHRWCYEINFHKNETQATWQIHLMMSQPERSVIKRLNYRLYKWPMAEKIQSFTYQNNNNNTKLERKKKPKFNWFTESHLSVFHAITIYAPIFNSFHFSLQWRNSMINSSFFRLFFECFFLPSLFNVRNEPKKKKQIQKIKSKYEMPIDTCVEHYLSN